MPLCHFELRALRPKPERYPKEISTLGDHIRNRRLDLDLLKSDVAEQIGVDTTTISQLARVNSLALVRYRGNDYPRYLLRMAELELLDRERRATERRIRQAKFPVTKSLDSFDFLAMPTLNKAMVLELARCEFLLRKENVLLLGNSGTGKTHIALALGLAACQDGYRVRFTTASALVSELIEARDEKKLLRFQKQIASYELLIVDELGFVPLSKTGAELLFEMLSQL